MRRSAHKLSVEALQEQAEQCFEKGKSRREILCVLERLLHEAQPESKAVFFAHWHWAALEVEKHPWTAALHLRKILNSVWVTEATFALWGLCHTQLGNVHAAIAAYKQAIALSEEPQPAYYHNVGHLLDVGLGRAHEGIEYLRIAQRLDAEDDEIWASLAHAWAVAGERKRALDAIERAVTLVPQALFHQRLLHWIVEGAQRDQDPYRAFSGNEIWPADEASNARIA